MGKHDGYNGILLCASTDVKRFIRQMVAIPLTTAQEMRIMLAYLCAFTDQSSQEMHPMSSRGQYTYAEIISQPAVWQRTLEQYAALQDRVRQAWAAISPKAVLFTGCGSTNYLSQTAAALLQDATGVPCRGAPVSEIALFGRQVMADPSHTLLVAVSRSGTTSETVAAMERFRQAGGRAIWE